MSETAKTPSVSLVVPFFNLEDYAVQSINTFLAQTIQDCEFIFVDDGSTDGTAAILDGYAKQDPRVKVIHKVNEGIAVARNAGVKAATGAYIAFADGDDIISPWYLEAMLQTMDGQGSTWVIAASKVVKLADCATVEWKNPLDTPFKEYNRQEIAELILYKKVGTTSWAKLGTRGLYLNNAFPAGEQREDVYSIAQFIAAHERFRYLPEPVYGYVMRPNSTVWNKSPTIDEAEDYLRAIEYSRDGLAAFVEPEANCVAYYDALMKTRLHEFLNRVSEQSPEKAALEKSVHEDVRQDVRKMLGDGKASLLNRIRLLMYAVSPKLVDVVYGLYRKIVKGL